ncbi:MAG: T9SS type A sorting domain-containing protein [Chitinophagales bacterium]|nr:T9SS type A sorting domain-containing protein [Chitinophagales bacterium]
MYPNPCDDYINIEGIFTNVSVLIYNSIGVLQQSLILHASEKVKIPTDILQNGMYFMIIKDMENGVSEVKQFIVHR